jgi:hypothetical protein
MSMTTSGAGVFIAFILARTRMPPCHARGPQSLGNTKAVGNRRLDRIEHLAIEQATGD